MPADQFRPENGPEEKRDSLARANAAKFVSAPCKYPGSPRLTEQAQQHILAGHAQRLTAELDGAVFAAYAASTDDPAWNGDIGDEEILEKLLELNLARSAAAEP